MEEWEFRKRVEERLRETMPPVEVARFMAFLAFTSGARDWNKTQREWKRKRKLLFALLLAAAVGAALYIAACLI